MIFLNRIPNVTVSTDEGGAELEISDDPYDCRQLEVTTIPIIVTLTKVQYVNSNCPSCSKNSCKTTEYTHS